MSTRTSQARSALLAALLWLCASTLGQVARAEPPPTPPTSPAAALRVLEAGAQPLRLLEVERGGQVVRFARGQRSFRFDVESGILVAGTDQPGDGVTRIQARPGLWVEAADDGTLRWRGTAAPGDSYRLAFYPALDGERWVLFTPSGYFDRDSAPRSRHGDWLVGWEFTEGKLTGERFPLWHFEPDYRRPEVARRVLAYDDGETSALRMANLVSPPKRSLPELRRLLPPRLIVNQPGMDSSVSQRWLNVSVALSSPSGEPIEALEARVQDMRTQVEEVSELDQGAGQRGMTLSQDATADWQVKRYRIRLLPESGRLTLSVRTRFTDGEPVTLRYRWQGGGRAQLPRLDALVIGISKYRDERRNLKLADKDARDLARVLEGQEGRSYRKVAVKQLLNQNATKAQVLAELDRLAAMNRDPDDVVVVFFAGHGTGDQEEGRYFFLPHDGDLTRPKETLLESSEIKQRIDRMVGRVLLFFDSCQSGGVFRLERGKMTQIDQSGATMFKSSLAEMLGVVVFAAARGNELAQEQRDLQNGVFTKALVEGLEGRADLKATGRITVSQLETYVGDRVRNLTDGKQTPATAKLGTIPDYDIAQVKVPLWKRRAFWPVVGGTLAVGLAASIITMVIVIKPDFDRGNTGWLAAP